MKSIFGGTTETYKCTCTLYIRKVESGSTTTDTKTTDPTDNWKTGDQCKTACDNLCKATTGCYDFGYMFTQSGTPDAPTTTNQSTQHKSEKINAE